jgi:hypothetical protein
MYIGSERVDDFGGLDVDDDLRSILPSSGARAGAVDRIRAIQTAASSGVVVPIVLERA